MTYGSVCYVGLRQNLGPGVAVVVVGPCARQLDGDASQTSTLVSPQRPEAI